MDVTRRGALGALLGTVVAGKQAAEAAAEELVAKEAVARPPRWELMTRVETGPQMSPLAREVRERISEMIDRSYALRDAREQDMAEFRSMSPAARRVFARLEAKQAERNLSVLSAAMAAAEKL